MKICLAQSRFHRGDIRANLDTHQQLINIAAENEVEAIFFPELSLTGYEPSQVQELYFKENDIRLLPFNVMSQEHSMIIGLGVPIKTGEGITIAMVIFEPDKQLQYHHKSHLHDDEKPFFVSGPNLPSSEMGNGQIALSICYELAVASHAEKALALGAMVYLSSVAKHRKGVAGAYRRMSEIAEHQQVFTMMVNAIGESEDGLCAGNSAVWDSTGQLLCRLSASKEGLLIFDTQTTETQSIYIS
ncbi:MAG: carbon-nitrogen hydrolase family protein [Cyclobacteriaceae bacterium]